MKYFCSLSDNNYLPLGLSLYDSLLETTKDDFILYYLCLDEKSYKTIQSINNGKIIPISLKKIMEENQELEKFDKSDYRDFVWMLASYFSNYLMCNKKIDHITYIDADIILYGDIEYFYSEIKEKSVGVIRHRHIPENVNSRDGKYNVGIVYFRGNEIGKKCLYWWKDAVFNKKYPELSTCHDQKYLEGFFSFFDNNEICVVDETIAHGAPWHYALYDWSDYNKDGTIIWNGKKQKFLFNHFSRYKFSIENNYFYNDSYGGETNNFKAYHIPEVSQINTNYFMRIKNSVKKYGWEK